MTDKQQRELDARREWRAARRITKVRRAVKAAHCWRNDGGKTMKEKILNWILTGRVGLSSKAMAAHLCGEPCDGSYPHDPADLNRCLLFLEAVPEARAELHRMATVNNVWYALVQRWAEIEAAFLAEVGRDWCKARSAPHTYRLMREIIDTANIGRTGPSASDGTVPPVVGGIFKGERNDNG